MVWVWQPCQTYNIVRRWVSLFMLMLSLNAWVVGIYRNVCARRRSRSTVALPKLYFNETAGFDTISRLNLLKYGDPCNPPRRHRSIPFCNQEYIYRCCFHSILLRVEGPWKYVRENRSFVFGGEGVIVLSVSNRIKQEQQCVSSAICTRHHLDIQTSLAHFVSVRPSNLVVDEVIETRVTLFLLSYYPKHGTPTLDICCRWWGLPYRGGPVLALMLSEWRHANPQCTHYTQYAHYN